MVNRLTKKAIISISKNIAMYGAEMAKLQEKISAIDEKYRKLAEEARKDLAAEYANLEAEQEIWQTSLSRYDAADVNEVLGEVDATSMTEDENDETESVSTTADIAEDAPEVVKDEIFPENNAPASIENPAETTPGGEMPMTPEEALSPEEKDIAALWPEYDKTPVTEPEEAVESPEPVEEAAPVEEEPIDLGLDVTKFPDFPQEW